MNPDLPTTRPARPANWWVRLHAALMPDYNRSATFYWWTVVLAGGSVLGWALSDLAQRDLRVWAEVAVAAGIAMLAGVFPVRIPHSKNSFAAGEIFIFLLLLVHGPAAAVVAAAGEGAIGSYRTSKRWTSRIGSPAMASLAMLVAGSALHWLTQMLAERGWGNAGLLIMAGMVFAVTYFVLNTVLVSALPRLKRGEALQLADLVAVFGWVGIAYAGSAAVAVLLYLTFLQSGVGVLMAMMPLLATMLAALHYFFRQQEAAEAMRQANAEAADREAELAARHMRELQASERRFHSAFTHASIGMALLSIEGRVLQVNPALRTLLAREDKQLLGREFQDFVLEDDRATLQGQLRQAGNDSFEGFALELRCAGRDGSPVWAATHCSFFSEAGSASPCLILQVQDIDARRQAEERLHHIAFHDALTGLPNRRRFLEHLQAAVDAAKADPADAFAVMFLDFDRFKLINDSLGHAAGDLFLELVARRIQEHLRPGDIVARLGGDEFAILVRPLDHERHAVQLAERLMEAMRHPFVVAGTELMTSASIGITFSALGYDAPDDVLRDADIAMYKAKGAGKARYALFDASLHREVARRLRLEGELRHAIEGEQLAVVYQPLLELSSGKLAGFEALVRWKHPTDGTISPGAFLPIAEEAGLMLRLTDFVMHCACRQLRAWLDDNPDDIELVVNVNVSSHDIAHSAFTARVTRALVESGLRPQQLCLELTENILAARLEGALPVLAGLRRLGVRLAIDDFGTGYSSLSHLSNLPIDTLKIDRSFVARIDDGAREASVVRSIVALGHSLGKLVVAEGIETPSQLEQLRRMGCRIGQGYLLGHPMAPTEVTALFERPPIAPGGARSSQFDAQASSFLH